MAQRTKYIDLSRTYLPIDPSMLPVTMHGTEGEDRPEGRMPVVPYEGWNFMPTGYGWRSYFGLTGKLNVDALAIPARTRAVFCFQKNDLTNLLVALCDNGVWTKQGESVGAWVQAIVYTDPDDGTVREWSWCTIENNLYVYRQAEPDVVRVTEAGVFSENVPTTLNMAGQLGVFKAGGRLGFWDSSNSVAHSAYANKFDVTPSIATGANITTITPLIGKIINILQHGDGFIIYATKSIIAVRKDVNNPFGWQAQAISTAAGIAYREQAVIAAPDTVHFAWTSIGLMRIENFQAQIISPEFYDFLKESQDPVYLKFLEGRYLAVCLANEDYVDGIVTFYTQTIASAEITLAEALTLYDGINTDDLTIAGNAARTLSAVDQQMAHINANSSGTCDPNSQGHCIGKDYPVYRDWFKHVNLISPGASLSDLATYSAIKDLVEAGAVDSLSFRLLGTLTDLVPATPRPYTFTDSRTKVTNPITTGTNEVLDAETTDQIITDDNDGNFFSKIRILCDAFNKLADSWLEVFDERIEPHVGSSVSFVPTVAPTSDEAVVPLEATQTGEVAVADISIEFERVEALPRAQNPDNTSAHIEIRHGFEYELGILSDTLPWGLVKATKVSERDLSYTTVKKLTNLTLHVITTLAGGALAGFAHADITGINNQEDLEEALQTLLDAAETHTSLPCTYYMAQGTPGAGSLADVGRPRAVYDNTYTRDAKLPLEHGHILLFDTASGGGAPLIVELRAADENSFENVDTLQLERDETITAVCSSPVVLTGYAYPDSYIRYLADGTTEASPNEPAEHAITLDPSGFLASAYAASIEALSVCTATPAAAEFPYLNSIAINAQQFNGFPVTTTVDGISWSFSYSTTPQHFTFPGATFLMQEGSPVPYDILWEGAFFYDTHLQRWGKMKAQFRQLLDFSPINSTSVGTVPFTNFGVKGAVLNNAGEIRMFDANPSDSYLKFGKIGMFRHGYTALESVQATFRQACSFSLEVESSIDGRTVENGLTKTYSFEEVTRIAQGVGNTGRWHNIGFRGQFDLSYLEFNAWTHSRR